MWFLGALVGTLVGFGIAAAWQTLAGFFGFPALTHDNLHTLLTTTGAIFAVLFLAIDISNWNRNR